MFLSIGIAIPILVDRYAAGLNLSIVLSILSSPIGFWYIFAVVGRSHLLHLLQLERQQCSRRGRNKKEKQREALQMHWLHLKYNRD